MMSIKKQNTQQGVDFLTAPAGSIIDLDALIIDESPAPSEKMNFSPRSELEINTGRRSPRFAFSCMSPERRLEVVKSLKKAIPALAEQRKKKIKECAEYARLCIMDAFAGRLANGLANNSKKTKWIYTIFTIQTSDWLFNSVVTASVLHTFAIFLEPYGVCPESWLFKAFQLGILAIYVFDIALKMLYEGFHVYMEHDWQRLYVLNLVLHILDLYLCGCTYYANALRPVAGVLRARKGRKFFEVLKKMVPEMLHNLVPILFFVVIVMVICTALYDRQVDEFQSTAYTFYNWWFLLLTNDNFDRLLPEGLFFNLSYLIFFFPAIYIGQRFLLNLIIGDTYNTFRTYVKAQLEKEHQKEMQGLTKAFAALDDEGSGKINDHIWHTCLKTYLPELTPEAICLYYELISGGEDFITVLQFLKLRSVLNLQLTVNVKSKNVVISKAGDVYNDLAAWYAHWHLFPVPHSWHKTAHSWLEYGTSHSYWSRGNLLDIVVLSFGFSDWCLLPLPSLLGSAEGTGAVYHLSPCQLIAHCHVGEFCLRLVAHHGKLHAVTGGESNRITYLFALGTVISLLYYPLLAFLALPQDYIYALPLINYEVSVRKVLLVMRLLRCLRLANLNNDLRNFNGAIVDILPALFETFSFTFIVSYIFGLLGNRFFGHVMGEWRTPLLSVVKAQQLTFAVNFLDSMETAMVDVHPLAVCYFALYLILSLTVSNIALSIIIDLHGNVLDMKTNKERAGMRKKIDIVFDKMVENARARQVSNLFRSRHGDMNFKNIRMSDFQSSDVRKFITGGGAEDEFKLKDLEKCNAQSNIDLVNFYEDMHRHHKDLNKEVEFVNNLHDLGYDEISFPRGTIITEANKLADKLYYLVKGTVVMIRPPHIRDRANMAAMSFFGAECLQPEGRYTSTIIADQETTCLVMEQDDIVHNIESELAGLLMRKAFKSWDTIENAFAEARKKTRRATAMTPQMDYMMQNNNLNNNNNNNTNMSNDNLTTIHATNSLEM